MTEPVLTVRGLSFGFPERALFADWCGDFLPGVSWIVGGDGSGKTILLKLMAGELPIGSADIRVDGARLAVGSDGRHAQVAWCDPRTDAFDRITPLAWFERLQTERPGFDAGLLSLHLAGFELTPHLVKPLYQLSTGSRRKVFIAGSLAANAPVTLLDQPGDALDDGSRRHLMCSLADCAANPGRRAWIVADYQLPGEGFAIAGSLQLPD